VGKFVKFNSPPTDAEIGLHSSLGANQFALVTSVAQLK
jgi:hypothetical protein